MHQVTGDARNGLMAAFQLPKEPCHPERSEGSSVRSKSLRVGRWPCGQIEATLLPHGPPRRSFAALRMTGSSADNSGFYTLILGVASIACCVWGRLLSP